MVGREIFADVELEEEEQMDFTGWQVLNHGTPVGDMILFSFILQIALNLFAQQPNLSAGNLCGYFRPMTKPPSSSGCGCTKGC